MRLLTLSAVLLGATPLRAHHSPPGQDTRVSWRLTDARTWESSRWVGHSSAHTFDGIIIDSYCFGVAAVSAGGHESVVVFPGS